ncbi:MAM domain-containing protein 2 MAM domain-containing proteoglycan [Larimichthys crocea]|uniref:MAM domain-containing protein 2 MAM domain-containing proteoglycan n=1 Tax=Larimichthys crocea TaxID=215358 RepID=A0A6G0IJ07_LARCR|nr:MAM domain-containing protein 2 isoform X1 [Larimichthys crocea]XP_027132997.1 MAM domain-containing protein 2 isoform X1 [Larimichthys crocea]KAE8291538.1 MAM domain-containing protein 2 MAM domain-containing proteoglycan [Larimichthys crocea]
MSTVCLTLQVLLLCRFLRAQQQLMPGSCNFELGTCGYTSDPEYGSWSMNEEGHLITVDSAFLHDQKQAVLVSPVLDQQEWSCVRLVYQITGQGSLQLHLRPDRDNFDYRLWNANKSSDSWLIASVDLPNTTIPYRILLEGRPGSGFGNSVAIFEIHIVPGYCIECNFEEHHLCGYSNSWNPNVNWYVGGSVNREPDFNLPGNHTNNNQRGHHMYVDSVYAKHFQEVAKLTSPMTTEPMAGCLSFYYHRDQERGNIFSVFTRDQLGHYEELWTPEVYATAGWSLVGIDIKAPHPLEVVFEVAFNSARGGYVAIDDISFSPEFCYTDTEPSFDPSMANCDFEDGLCLYYQERVESKVWSRVSVKPNAYRIGDHTTGTGCFLLANTRFTSRPGYMGRLHGPFLPGNHKYCLRFYYLLHGFKKADNALVLYIYDENNVAQEKVWSLADTSRAVWTKVEITYMKPMRSKLVFASICKNFWECGLVAIDDITVSLGDCRITTGSFSGQCDFESGVCGYIQEKKIDKADWLRVRGHTPTSYTGPRGDHTTGVGYFMYIEASLMRPGHKARLLTSDLRGSLSPQCLIFYYHMYGSGTGILSVLLHHGSTERDTLLWRRRGEQSVSWMRAMVDYHCDVRHQIIFEAIRGPSLRSDIAIDDIHFKSGPCEDPGDITPYSGFSEYFNEIEN